MALKAIGNGQIQEEKFLVRFGTIWHDLLVGLQRKRGAGSSLAGAAAFGGDGLNSILTAGAFAVVHFIANVALETGDPGFTSHWVGSVYG